MSRQHAHAHAQAPLFRYERHPEEDLGRRLIASSDIRKDRLIFVERPVVAMQSMGNMHEGVLVCSYCMAFCGSPEQTLRVMSDPSCLKDIATNNTATTTATAGTTTTTCTPCRNDSDGNNTSTVVIDDPHALYCCRHNCGHVYCSLECQQDDWEWGGHKELCTGLIPDPDEPDSDQSNNNNNENGGDPSEEDTAVDVVAVVEKSKLDPLLEFKIHAGNTNEIFFLVATWLVRILKHDLPYHEDDNLNSHPYTDFQMNPWWDVKAKEEEGLAAMKQQQTDSGERKENNDNNDDDNNNNNNNDATTESLADVLKQLCEESCSHLSKALVERQPRFRDSPWLTPVGMARLIGSLEQNCLGIRRKHALQRNLMLDADLRQTFHDELIRCLEGAGMIGGIDDDEEDEDGACDDDCSCDEDDGDAKAEADGDTDTSSTDATNTNVAHNADANADANANTDTDLGTEEGVDTEAETSTSNKHSPDAVASFLAGLTQDLTDGCVLDEWDEVIRPLDGVSHYSIATKMNHSCEPNVVLVYKTRGWGRDHPLVAYVVALRDIAEGDELTISYVDSDDPYEERQAALANYGFVCACRKCQREKTGETAMGGGDNGAEVDTNSFPEDDDDDDLFGGDDDDEDDEADLFGDDDDEDDDTEGETNTHTATNHNNPDGNDEHNGDSGDTREEEEEEDAGAESLLELAERLDAVRNESRHGAIPLEYLAPASNYVLKLIASLLDDIANIDATNDFDFDFELKESLLRRIRIAVRDRVFSDCRAAGSDLESRLYRRLESIGSWPTPMHRASYWCAAIAASIGVCHEGSFLAAMKYLDKATMLGQDRGAIGGYFGYVELHASQMAAGPCPIAVGCKVSDYRCPSLQRKVVTSGGGLSGPIRFPVEEVTAIANGNGNGNGNESITHRSHILACCRESKACVVRGFASEWEAVETWRNLDELAREFGHRLVPIEIGSMTNTSGMKEAVVTFRRFVADYLSASATKDCWSLEDATRTTDADNHNHDHNHNNNHNKHHPRIAYLAQHPLLDQIPALSESLETNPCGVNPTNINVWMGTGGTRTPLHFDSYDNLLVQIVGAKYVRLYEKEHTPRLYVRTGAKSTSTSTSTSYGAQGNMSELDCEQEDYEQHPLARDCEYREVLLFPGDCLFIPSRQWHYVRSLSTSVSVNYWF